MDILAGTGQSPCPHGGVAQKPTLTRRRVCGVCNVESSQV